MNCYESSGSKIVDKYFYICDDKINDLIVAPVAGQMVMNPIIACQDKQVRILSDLGDGKTEILYTQKFEAACVSISLCPDLSTRSSPIIAYGLANGEIGVLELMRSKSMVLWNLEASQISSGQGAPVSLVKACNLNKSKIPGGASPKKRSKESKAD